MFSWFGIMSAWMMVMSAWDVLCAQVQSNILSRQKYLEIANVLDKWNTMEENVPLVLDFDFFLDDGLIRKSAFGPNQF